MELRNETSSGEQLITTAEGRINPPLLLRASVDVPSTAGEPSTSHGIRWLEGTVDNEFLGRKKSNCCCIYKKPRRWDESSSSSSSSDDTSDDENGAKPVRHTHCTEHCRGHTKHCYRKKNTQSAESQQETQVATEQIPNGSSLPERSTPAETPNHSLST
ncbi:Protein phosphatase 1 regulatory subunit 11 [Fasciolopsis buskii]|uniref:E3 ubiquitin-protein ligase PPP1R11 n=1 Tax=Fasciolopsis buskii TaxID=27845 RepID=A0A8E0RZY2_9TREM|nr:Protein phosphatase 1 regulatory subunit 11 [Fasciolopsis buski]